MSNHTRPEQSSFHQLLLLCGSFFCLFMGIAAVQQFLVPILSDRAHVSNTNASLLFSLVYFSGPVWLALYGYCFQVLREKWSVVLSGCMYTAFGLLVYFTHDYRMAIVATVLWGWGAETLWATGPAQVVNVSDPRRRGSIAGLFQSSTYSGQMLGVILFGYMLGRYSEPRAGQDAVLLTAVGISLIGNVLSLFLRVKPKDLPPARLRDAIAALDHPAGRYLILLSVANYLGWGLVLTSFTMLVVQNHQLDKLSWIILPYYLGRLAVAWVAGRTSDKVGRERVMMAGFIFGAVALGTVAFFQSPPVVAAAALILGMQAAMVSVAMTAAVGDYIKPDERHLVFAGTNAWGYLTAGVTMTAGPLIRQWMGNFTATFLIFAVFYALCAFIAAGMRARLAREKAEAA